MTALTIEEAVDLIYAPYRTVAITENLESFYPDINANGPPTDNAKSWARLKIQHTSGRQASLAGDTSVKMWAMKGVLTTQLFTPFGGGGVTGQRIVLSILNAYRKANSSVWFREPRFTEVGISGTYYQINILVDFEYDQIE